MNLVIPMAGDSKIFKDAGFKYNKNFTEINHKPLFRRVFDSAKKIGEGNFIFVETAGAACSVLLAAKFINRIDGGGAQ